MHGGLRRFLQPFSQESETDHLSQSNFVPVCFMLDDSSMSSLKMLRRKSKFSLLFPDHWKTDSGWQSRTYLQLQKSQEHFWPDNFPAIFSLRSFSLEKNSVDFLQLFRVDAA